MRLLAGVLHSDEIVWNSYTWDADAHKQINTKAIKFDVNSPGPSNWNTLIEGLNPDIPIKMYTTGNAGVAVGSPKDCYKYGVLISITVLNDLYGKWRNFLIYIEDLSSDSSGCGNMFIRSGNRMCTKWKKFSGEKVDSVSS